MKSEWQGRWRRFLDRLNYPRLKWQEPRAFVKLLDAYEVKQQAPWKRWLKAIGMAALISGVMYADAAAKKQTVPSWWELTILPLGFGILCAYFPVWFKGWGLSWVRFGKESISRHHNRRNQSLRFGDVLGYGWLRNEREQFYTLQLERTNGSTAFFGVPDAATRDKVDALLREAGVTCLDDVGGDLSEDTR